MMTLFARWFEEIPASQDYRTSDYIVLAIILAAGVVLRFWGLGNVGLHGDEETMAMPTMALLESGQPLLPSGMYYARAMLNLYLMAGSVWMFGESEWAFRFPSALVGSVTGLAAFFMGRRFLSPQFNLALVATITLLPAMIIVSQTARMYVFFVTCIIWFAACIFRWERDQRVSSLILALFVWLLAVHFQILAIFAAPLFLFPGLSRQSWKQLVQGGAAFVVGWLLFQFQRYLIASRYPDDAERPPDVHDAVTQTPLDAVMAGSDWLFLAAVAAACALSVFLIAKGVRTAGWQRTAPVLLVTLGLLAVSALQYHLGGILLMIGIVFWLREPRLSRGWLAGALLLAALIAAVHLGILYNTGLYPGRKLIGAVVGMPSVWPVLRFLEYSPVAGVVFGIAFVFALVRFSQGRPLPMLVLFFVMAVWAALLVLGYFAWYIPPRYAMGQLGYFLLCAFAGLAYLGKELRAIPDASRLSNPSLLLLMLVSAALINPIALGRTVNPGYDLYPDHKGAAEHIRSLDLSPDAILIAEDVLQQTYYLGRVDYSLRPADDAVNFSFVRDGQVIDQYTGAPVLGTGAELQAVLDANRDKDVYIIGSGENFIDGVRMFRTLGIREVLESDGLEVVFEGRDGKTRIWESAP